MKLPVEFPPDSFLDDKPCFDWDQYQDTPTRSWRHGVKPRFEPREVAIQGLIGLAVFVAVFVVLIIAFCW